MQKAMSDPDAYLYSVPDSLKQYMHSESKLLKSQEDGTKWLAGIAEVDLPASATIKNIERTQEAIEAMAQDFNKPKDKPGVPRGNFSTNFQVREDRFTRKQHKVDLLRFKKGQNVAR
jgi:hypothetical protein